MLERTDGNPFFIREMVSLRAERGAEARPVDTSSREPEVPAGVREVIRGRLRHLSPTCTQTLEIASAVGREFAMELLEGASGLGREPLAEALDEAQRAGLVDEASNGGYRFAHALTQEAIYAEQSAPPPGAAPRTCRRGVGAAPRSGSGSPSRGSRAPLQLGRRCGEGAGLRHASRSPGDGSTGLRRGGFTVRSAPSAPLTSSGRSGLEERGEILLALGQARLLEQRSLSQPKRIPDRGGRRRPGIWQREPSRACGTGPVWGVPRLVLTQMDYIYWC